LNRGAIDRAAYDFVAGIAHGRDLPRRWLRTRQLRLREFFFTGYRIFRSGTVCASFGGVGPAGLELFRVKLRFAPGIGPHAKWPARTGDCDAAANFGKRSGAAILATCANGGERRNRLMTNLTQLGRRHAARVETNELIGLELQTGLAIGGGWEHLHLAISFCLAVEGSRATKPTDLTSVGFNR
jgi:hypothetical protein